MKPILFAIALSLAFGPAFAQTRAIEADQQQVQKDKQKLRADQEKAAAAKK